MKQNDYDNIKPSGGDYNCSSVNISDNIMEVVSLVARLFVLGIVCFSGILDSVNSGVAIFVIYLIQGIIGAIIRIRK